MKRSLALLCMMSLTILSLAACNKREEAPAVTKAAAPAAPEAAANAARSGKVLETMEVAGYTYVQVDTGSETFWAAGPVTPVKVGDAISVPAGMAMNNFESKSLNRKFEVIYFVPALMVGGAGAQMPAMNGAAQQPAAMPASPGAPKVVAPENISFQGLAKADQSVADIYSQKAALDGKAVKVRGKVVKFSANIMGKNWLHLQDGSGQDLTVTTAASAQPGDTVVISGKLTADKDFGYGYKYDVLVEDAQVTKE